MNKDKAIAGFAIALTKKTGMKWINSKKTAMFVFVFPTLVLYTMVVFYPILQTVYKSLFKWDGITLGGFVGLRHYIKLFTADSTFRISLRNGLLYPLVTASYQIGLGTVIALLLASRHIRGSRFFKSIYFIPSTLSTVIICKLWLSILASDESNVGLLNRIFEVLGLSYRQNWLASGLSGILTLAFITAWQGIGNTILLIYTAIKAIPEQYYEAAVIDGASPLTAHRKVTLPLLAETYKLLLILIISGGLRAFEHMYIMTGGGPGNATSTLAYMMYKSAYISGNFGYACAVAVSLILECLFFTLLINKLVARERISY